MTPTTGGQWEAAVVTSHGPRSNEKKNDKVQLISQWKSMPTTKKKTKKKSQRSKKPTRDRRRRRRWRGRRPWLVDRRHRSRRHRRLAIARLAIIFWIKRAKDANGTAAINKKNVLLKPKKKRKSKQKKEKNLEGKTTKLQGGTEFYLVLFGYLGVDWFDWVLLGFIGFHWVWLFNLVWLDFN